MATEVFDLKATLGIDSSKFDQGLKNAVKVGLGAITAATAAMGKFGADAVKVGMDFDQSMSQVYATMGDKANEMVEYNGQVVSSMDALRDYAQEMGRTTAFSATESADALNYMALAGYTAKESMAMLPNVLNLASAGNMDLAKASDMVTDAQTALGLVLEDGQPDFERTTQLVDEMAKAASTGNTSVEQLGDAFLVVGGIAQELNGGMVTLADGTEAEVDGIQELEIALTAMANAGIKGSEAGTHMRNMLLKLSDPTDDGVAALERMGVAVFDTEGNMRSLSNIFGDLSNAMGSMTQEEKIGTIADLFNTRDIASAEALLNAVGQDWDEIGESILNAKGAADKMATTQLDNLAGSITLFKSALEGAQIAISDVLSPSLRDFVDFGTDGLQKLTASFQEGGLEGAMETFGVILSDGLNMIIGKLPEFVNAGIQLLSALGQGLMDNLPAIIEAGNEILLQLVTALIDALPQLVEGAIQIISQLAVFLGEHLPELIPAIIDMVLAITDALIDNVDLLIDGAIALIVGLAQGLVNAIPKLIEKVPIIIDKLVMALINALPKIVKAGMDILLALIDGIIKSIPKILPAVNQIKDTLATGFIKLMNSASEWGRDLINNFIDGLKQKWNDLKNTVSEMAGTVSDYLHFSEPEKGPLSNFHTYAPDMMALFAQGIKDNTDIITDQIKDSFDFHDDIVSSQDTFKSVSGNKNVVNGSPNISVNVTLEGVASEILRIVKQEARKEFNSSGYNTIVYGG